MFVIRQEHMDAFSRAARESFEDRVAAQLRARFGTLCEDMNDDDLYALIDEGIHRAAGYEICSERDVATFIRYMLGIRRDFDTSRATAWAGAILREAQVSPHERLARIKAAAREHRLAQEVKA
jgi:hypothetical protein